MECCGGMLLLVLDDADDFSGHTCVHGHANEYCRTKARNLWVSREDVPMADYGIYVCYAPISLASLYPISLATRPTYHIKCLDHS